MKVTRGVYIRVEGADEFVERFLSDIDQGRLPTPMCSIGCFPAIDGNPGGCSQVFHEGDVHLVETWLANERRALIAAEEILARRRAPRPTTCRNLEANQF